MRFERIRLQGLALEGQKNFHPMGTIMNKDFVYQFGARIGDIFIIEVDGRRFGFEVI